MSEKQSGPSLIRAAGLVLVSMALIYLIIAVSIANIAEDRQPNLALRLNPFHAKALSAAAFEEFKRGGPEANNLARELSERAIRRDPTAVGAIRTLGFVADVEGKHRKASALMRYSATLTRRDVATHLWLIEKYVASDDLQKALAQYDKAMRTSKLAYDTLGPILIEAISDDRILEPLVPVLVKQPVWANPFLKDLISTGKSSDNIANLIAKLDQANFPLARDDKLLFADRLISEQRFASAANLLGRNAQRAPIVNGNFQREGGDGPFEWKLHAGYDIGSSQGLVSGGASDLVLSIFATQDHGGEVARQLIQLKPGQYRLSTKAGGVPQGVENRPYWKIVCAETGTVELLRLDLPGSERKSSQSTQVFAVPNNCQAQWLMLIMRPPTNERGVESWVESVAISTEN